MKQLNKTSRSYTSIFLENIFTVFNGLLAVCFCLVILAGSPQDALFVIVVFINMLIGIVVEVKAKWDLDKLSILIANKVKILKKEKFQNLSESNFQKILQDKTNSQIEEDIEEAEIDQVRAGDVVYISSGDQIVIDGKVLKSNGLEVDQSILTGESDTVKKQTNDEVLSGSVAVSGSAICLVRAVGADSYIEKIAVEAKKYKLIKSDLVDGVNKILKYISFGILPIALLLLYSQAREYGSINDIFINGQWKEAVVQATAGIVGMIPEGLVLLTSFNFALAVIILARQKVIIQQLPAVEGLARVDTLCLDKTGTITDGTIVAENIEILDKLDENSIKILSAIIEFTTKNNTSLAIEDYINKTFLLKDRKKHLDINESDIIEFSSKRKYSGLIVNNDRGFDGKWLLGAPEIVINPKFKKDNLFGNISDNLAKGKRVLALAKNGQPKLLIICSENIRSDAAKTIAYFYKQGINPIIISGDSSESVSQIAKGVNFKNIAEYNSQNLPNNMEEVREIVKKYNVFGRVLPDQKKILVQALQSAGKTVAMTGDGVNDVLALKQSDLSVVMANAAPAAKSIAHIVLTDS
ncbi:MAG: HAD-IC family P-type ATPase, partial [Bifidobacteriaceae bacterium]|nr:HAD-IC family P-type ATPase [Bifidobacteriaceae bacterium]